MVAQSSETVRFGKAKVVIPAKRVGKWVHLDNVGAELVHKFT